MATRECQICQKRYDEKQAQRIVFRAASFCSAACEQIYLNTQIRPEKTTIGDFLWQRS